MIRIESSEYEVKKLKQAAMRTSGWAVQNERTKIGFDPIKEHDRSKDTNLLLEYRPTMLFVEHDIHFREKVATKTVEL